MNKPKYNVGQKVWAIEMDKATERQIVGIMRYDDENGWYYSLSLDSISYAKARIPESSIFPDKDSFINSLK